MEGEGIDQKDPIKIFKAENSKFLYKKNGAEDEYYEFQAGASVKAGERILFKMLTKDRWADIHNLKICFKGN